jgi:hypothetical protein
MIDPLEILPRHPPPCCACYYNPVVQRIAMDRTGFGQTGHVGFWPETDLPPQYRHVRCQGMNGPGSDGA